MNVSVGFDPVALKPTFELLYGVPGNSRAFETAARLGFDSRILDKAKTYLKESNRRILEFIEDLQSTLQSIRAIKRDFAEVLRAASRYEELIRALAKKIERKKEDVLFQVEGKARALFRQAESELKKVMKSARATEVARGTSVKRDLNRIKNQALKNMTREDRTKSTLECLEKGTRLVLGKERKEGEVAAIDYEANKVELLIGDMRLKTSIDELEHMKGVQIIPRHAEQSKRPGITTPLAEPPGSSSPLNLIGLTVDEALPIVDKALDRALLYGKRDLHIVHGVGTGRLRKGIHDYLKQQAGVKAFYPGKPLEGGVGITIVELD
jgi:DNA mismatch repair protein MutS2